MWLDLSQERSACVGIIDTQEEVTSKVWFRSGPQHRGLDIVELESHDVTR